MMFKFSMTKHLQDAGVPDGSIEKVKSTILVWFTIGLLSGIASGMWFLAMIMKYR